MTHIRDSQGQYTFFNTMSSEEILDIADRILRRRFRKGDPLGSPTDTKRFLLMQLRGEEQEIFCCLFLDTRNRIISFDKMFYGTIDGASVHPREVVKRAMKHNAAAVILAHNHPSGISEPSRADRALTKRVRDALELVDVRLLDHFVCGEEVFSFAENGFM